MKVEELWDPEKDCWEWGCTDSLAPGSKYCLKHKSAIHRLEQVISYQRQQLATLQESNYEKNKKLDAMHYVWCDGGCEGGCLRYTKGPVQEELVMLAEQNAIRLRRWFENRRYAEHVQGARPSRIEPMTRWALLAYAWETLKRALRRNW